MSAPATPASIFLRAVAWLAVGPESSGSAGLKKQLRQHVLRWEELEEELRELITRRSAAVTSRTEVDDLLDRLRRNEEV